MRSSSTSAAAATDTIDLKDEVEGLRQCRCRRTARRHAGISGSRATANTGSASSRAARASRSSSSRNPSRRRRSTAGRWCTGRSIGYGSSYRARYGTRLFAMPSSLSTASSRRSINRSATARIKDVRGRLGYEFSPKTSAFIETAREWRNYDDSTLRRQWLQAACGPALRVHAPRQRGGGRRLPHQESNGILDDIDSWAFRAQLRYDITPLLRTEIVGSRDIGAPSMDLGDAASNRIESEIGVRADYALGRDLTLTVGAGTAGSITSTRSEMTATYASPRAWNTCCVRRYRCGLTMHS